VNFARSSLLLLAGSVFSQAIPLLALPVITRIFAPDSLGLQTLAITWATAISVVATLRLDLASVLPNDDRRSQEVLGATLTSILVVVPIIALSIALGSQLILAVIGRADGALWLWMLPLLSIAMALTQMGTAIMIREGRFGRMSTVNIVNQGVTQSLALGFGLYNSWWGGLILARVAGQVAAVVSLLPAGLAGTIRSWRPSLRQFKSVSAEFRQFIVFNTPYSLLSTIARDAPLLVFGALASAASVGLYGVARLVMFVPTSLASVSLSPVFFREAAKSLGSPELESLARRLLGIGTVLSAPAFALILVFGPDLFEFAFGFGWRRAGEFASILAIPFWVSVQSSWIGRVFEVAGKQRRQFVFQLGSDALIIAAVTTAMLLWRDLNIAVSIFAILTSFYYLGYFFLAANAAAFDLARLSWLWLVGFGLFAVMACLLWAAEVVLPEGVSPLASTAAMVFVTLVVALAKLGWLTRR
jgi:O-antigen/teichoic acid export membrane protein